MSAQAFQIEHVDTPTGAMRLVTDDRGSVRALDWDDHDDRFTRLLRRHYQDSVTLRPRASQSEAHRALTDYFAGALQAIDRIPVATAGTPFQREVWAALRTIPAGDILSYASLAKRVGRPAAVRAVGLANGSNPIGIIVPCHRVIGANGSLTGYGGGLDRKRWLLNHEGVALKNAAGV